MKIKDVLEILENAIDDSENSKMIFNLEEGHEDNQIKSGLIARGRRDWLIIADIYNNGKYSQKFHLWNFLQFKTKNDKRKLLENFSYGRIQNGALLVYIKEVIFKEDATQLVAYLKKYYELDNGRINKFKTTTEFKTLFK
ncbi:hypothetical protein LJC13_01315 [Peptostreptococcaceae bacterium OttesenSCG-928-C18]|nr:hypothetical protein [Peptostreptococcaceae bacterium OttesenSCG-928-C18]